MAIGYNSDKVKVPPTSFADLLKPDIQNQVAINGSPTQASAAFSAGVRRRRWPTAARWTTSRPASPYFKKLHQVGNFVPVTASPTTVESGQTPIVVWWDYLLASEIRAARQELQDRDPVGRATTPPTTDQAISKTAPHPAAARLWRSTCTRPPARTCGCRARPGRSSCRR